MSLVQLDLRGRAAAAKKPKTCGGLTPAFEPTELTSSVSRRSALAQPTAPTGKLVVVKGPVPPSSHVEEREALERYKLLCKPLPVAAAPSSAFLQNTLAALAEEFPWAPGVLAALEDMLSAPTLWGAAELRLEPALLVGHPGSGKSRLVRRLAELLQLPYMPLALGGAHDPKLLYGTARGWSSADASPVLRMLVDHKSASGLVHLDELDKVNRRESGLAIHAQLLGLLEPETASRWRDSFLMTACDLSRVSFWGTANGLKTIAAPLLSRMELLYMPAPGPEHLPAIAASMVRQQEREWHLPAGTLPEVPCEVYSRFDSLRALRRQVRRHLVSWAQEYRRPERMH